MPDKFCVDCRHHHIGRFSYNHPAGHVCTYRKPTTVDQITGEVFYTSCEQMRRILSQDEYNKRQCIKGAFWAPREELK